MYASFVCYCYALLQQQTFLSRNEIIFKFISEKAIDDVKIIVLTVNENRGSDGIYKCTILVKKREDIRWFGEKNKVQICFLPTSKEYETNNIGCATVFFQILQNTRLITISHTKSMVFDGKENGSWL